MKADNVKSLLEYLSDDQVTNDLCEARNRADKRRQCGCRDSQQRLPERHQGRFVKEDGEWKLTNRSPEVPAK